MLIFIMNPILTLGCTPPPGPHDSEIHAQINLSLICVPQNNGVNLHIFINYYFKFLLKIACELIRPLPPPLSVLVLVGVFLFIHLLLFVLFIICIKQQNKTMSLQINT